MIKSETDIATAIDDCLRGDTSRFASIVNRFQSSVYRYCFYFCLSAPDAEDATMDIFVKVYRALPTFNPRYGFSAWLFRIAHNHMVEAHRRNKRIKKYRLEAVWAAGDAGEGVRPEEVFFKDVASGDVKDMLAALDPKYRAVLMLRYYQDRSYQEIADIMKIKKNTVASLIMRGKKELRRRYEALGDHDAML